MKINTITSYRSSVNLNSNNNNSQKQRVHFGFGEDYGPSPFDEPNYQNAPNDDFFSALKCVVQFPFAVGKEIIQNIAEQRRFDKQYEEICRRSREAKEAQQNVDNDFDANVDFGDED